MPNCSIDLTVTSPPYDNLRRYKGYSFPFEEIAKELYRVTKQGGVLVWVVGDATVDGSETGTSFRQALYFKEIGFNLHDTMFYLKDGMPSNIQSRYQNVVEYMFVLSKGKPVATNLIKDQPNKDYRPNGKISKSRNKDGEQESKRWFFNEKVVRKNVWYYAVGMYGTTSDKIAFEHPAIFPESLAADHIKSWSNEGDIVYDCFSGSGTTAKMAHLLNRRWIGSEISKEYCELSYKRIKPFIDQKQIEF
ncbi:MAG: site-specific DNA-methyltransferase [Patescibacteria group bacterium]|nr:site-specific DNA-methyltransferase [Patescibacteria group bacterium]